MKKKQYPLFGQLSENAAIHCASLVIAKSDVIWLRDTERYSEFGNGTITFVKSEGKVYGITCKHVIDEFRRLNEESGKPMTYCLQTIVNGYFSMVDRFINPHATNGDNLDIMINEINPDHIKKIGKIPFNIDKQNEMPHPEFGYAVGFPEVMKYKKEEKKPKGAFRISLPQCEILAEIEEKPNRRFALFSELDEVPKHTDFSGMSGGPIFWGTEDSYGMYGIAYEAGVWNESGNDACISVFGELATPNEIKYWIEQIK